MLNRNGEAELRKVKATCVLGLLDEGGKTATQNRVIDAPAGGKPVV